MWYDPAKPKEAKLTDLYDKKRTKMERIVEVSTNCIGELETYKANEHLKEGWRVKHVTTAVQESTTSTLGRVYFLLTLQTQPLKTIDTQWSRNETHQ
jgi:hypothetical protein